PGLDDLCKLLIVRENPQLRFLHAACLAVQGGAVSLVGESHSGKMTLARAWNESGAALLADDLAPLDPAHGVVYPFLTAPSLCPGPASLPAAEATTAAPLRHVVLLKKPGGAGEELLPPVSRERWAELMWGVTGVHPLRDD